MHITLQTPVVIGRSFFFEYNSDAKSGKIFERVVDEYDTLYWVWKFHFIKSIEGRKRYARHGADKDPNDPG